MYCYAIWKWPIHMYTSLIGKDEFGLLCTYSPISSANCFFVVATSRRESSCSFGFPSTGIDGVTWANTSSLLTLPWSRWPHIQYPLDDLRHQGWIPPSSVDNSDKRATLNVEATVNECCHGASFLVVIGCWRHNDAA